MKSTLSLISIILFCQFSMAQNNTKATFQKMFDEVNNHSEAYKQLQLITSTIGHRLTGSANGSKAEAYVYDLLKSYGLQVSFQSFSAQGWERESLSFTLNNQHQKAVALAHSPTEIDLKEDILDLGNGLESDYQQAGDKVKGKIVLVYLHILPNSGKGLKNLHRSEKTALASHYGAKGIVFINSVKGNVLLTGTASISGKLIDIPAICIGLEDGMKWKQTLEKEPVTAEVHMRNQAQETTARNIIVHIQGNEYPEEKIVIGGHLDSWDLATGAIDNGLGSFAIIDMARTFQKLKLQTKRSIDFVLFMGEEQGLLGSKAYVSQAIQNGTFSQIKYMLNFDMVNAPIGFSSSQTTMKSSLDQWGEIYAQVDTAFKNKNTIDVGLHSDHQPFMLEGVPTGTARGGQLPNQAGLYYHSDKDLFDLVDQQGLKQTVRVGMAYLYMLANEKELSSNLLTDEATMEFLESNGLKEPLLISGDWRWGK